MLSKQFPILNRKIKGRRLVYLDNASTAQKPRAVIETISDFYQKHNANIHRGIHTLSQEATTLYEGARDKIKKFINAKSREEIIFTSGATESINLVVWTWGHRNIKRGDEILLTEMEHHSNLVPWQMLAKKKRAELKFIPITKSYELKAKSLIYLITSRTKIVSLTQVSNVLGTINPVGKIIKAAHAKGAKVLIDGAQAGGHIPIDVQKLGCDFYVLSGHKMYGPTGVGVLYGRRELLEKMPPYQTGGHMIKRVSLDPGSSPGHRRKLRLAWNALPYKFEAGTANIAEVIGLGTAVNFLTPLIHKRGTPSLKVREGGGELLKHEKKLTDYALKRLRKIPGLTIYGPQTAKDRIGIISFNLKVVPPHDLASILDQQGIAIRTGHHCAMPLHEKLGVESTARISLALYNTKEDIDKLIEGIKNAHRVFSA
ncbi:MAG: cysteine desulfurase [Candidatus Doudnabacteria bacterium]|nr:cysteine desulfurase [Candidatus Doudnabacteria bacterium]